MLSLFFSYSHIETHTHTIYVLTEGISVIWNNVHILRGYYKKLHNPGMERQTGISLLHPPEQVELTGTEGGVWNEGGKFWSTDTKFMLVRISSFQKKNSKRAEIINITLKYDIWTKAK